jgi:hypothetical protein
VEARLLKQFCSERIKNRCSTPIIGAASYFLFLTADEAKCHRPKAKSTFYFGSSFFESKNKLKKCPGASLGIGTKLKERSEGNNF